MRQELRFEDNETYWDKRWEAAHDDQDHFDDLDVYPIKYAEMVMKEDPRAKTIELGCGLGRVLKHYFYKGHDITGIERSKIAVRNIQRKDNQLKVLQGDVSKLPFHDEAFDNLLAFGLYHNIEKGMVTALKESFRCLKKGGKYCISMRPDNLEMRLNEVYWRWKKRKAVKRKLRFHKWLVKEKEFKKTLRELGCPADQVYFARNVSLLWRIPWLRLRFRHELQESELRAKGSPLNVVGKFLDQMIQKMFPSAFCNVLVFVGRKI